MRELNKIKEDKLKNKYNLKKEEGLENEDNLKKEDSLKIKTLLWLILCF